MAAIHKNGPLGPVNNHSSPTSVGIISIPAFTVPFYLFVFVKSKFRHHGIVHFPAIVHKMSFGSIDLYFLGKTNIKRPTSNVQFVGGIVAHFRSTVIPSVPMPIVIPGFGSIFPMHGRSLPQVPIQTFRHGGCFLVRYLATSIAVKSNRFVSIADGAFMNLFYNLYGVRRGTLLIPHLHHFTVLFGCVYNHLVLLHGTATRLLYIYMLARFHGHNGPRGMPMVWHSVNEYIYLIICHHLKNILL